MRVDSEAYKRGLKDGREGRVPDLPMPLPPSAERAAYATGWKRGALERGRDASTSPSDALRINVAPHRSPMYLGRNPTEEST